MDFPCTEMDCASRVAVRKTKTTPKVRVKNFMRVKL